MNYRTISIMGILATAGIATLAIMLSHTDPLESGLSGSVGSAIDALPSSAAGLPTLPAQAAAKTASPQSYLGGTKATGRISEVYVKVADNVFLALNQAPKHLQDSGERWVDVQFPELLANDVDSARAILNRGDAQVQVGDVVEIKFAHKSNSRYFPVKELTRVTQFVAKKDEMLAKDYERRILARSGHTDSPPDWLRQARVALPAAAESAAVTTADAGR